MQLVDTKNGNVIYFCIKYGRLISEQGYNIRTIRRYADEITGDITETMGDEMTKGLSIYRFLSDYFKKDNATETVVDVPGKNILLYGVPGAGKSNYIKENYCDGIDEEQIERVVFHPDYTYSDFVGQIMPRINGKGDGVKYVFEKGPFTKILEKATKDPDKKPYYLIIEEINRGNAPAIFGEIFQLLDRKKKKVKIDDVLGESEYGITNRDVALEVYGDENKKVLIPSNLWIIATMNTADQNVFTLDTAFQRRWDMQHIPNDVKAAKHADQKIEQSEISWGAFAYIVNNQVIQVNKEISSSEDKRLGAYFVSVQELAKKPFSEKVLKYLWDDAFKMNHEDIFLDKMDSLDEVLETYEKAKGDPLKSVITPNIYGDMLDEMQKIEAAKAESKISANAESDSEVVNPEDTGSEEV